MAYETLNVLSQMRPGEILSAGYTSLIHALGLDFDWSALSLDGLPDLNIDFGFDAPEVADSASTDKVVSSEIYQFETFDKNDQVAVIERTTDEPAFIDKNDDDDLWEKRSVKLPNSIQRVDMVLADPGEVFPGLDRDTINADVQDLRDRGFKGNFVTYSVTDCNGNNLVACWDIELKEWGMFYTDENPSITTEAELDAYIAGEQAARAK